jgi:hypothetical protein
MAIKITETEKILSEALELHEKGVSLHSIVRTYPEHKEDIEALFGTMATVSLEKEKVIIPKDGLERLLRALPELESTGRPRASIKSPFAALIAGLQLSSLKFVLPIAALVILSGGFALHTKNGVAPSPVAMTATDQAPLAPLAKNDAAKQIAVVNPTAKQAATETPTPMAMSAAPASPADRLIASFSEEAATESTIAKRNDAENPAVAEESAVMSDPTQTYEN